MPHDNRSRDMTWTAYALLTYVLAQVALSAYVARKVRTESDYLVAGRSLGLAMASISLFATWFGAETVMGASGAVAAGGIDDGRADPFGYTICLLLMALFLAYKMRSREYMTFGDFFRDRFGPKTEKLAVFVMIPTSLMWAAAQILAFAGIFSAVTGIDMDVSLIVTVVILVTYSSTGGMIGDVVTDVVEAGVVVLGLIVMLAVVVMKAGGIAEAFSSIDPSRLSLISPDESILSQMDTWAIPIMGSLVAQEAMSRLLATKTPEIARRACLTGAGIYLIVGTIPLLIGLMGNTMAGPVEDQDSFLPHLALQILPAPLYVLLLGALISAILSTINSILLASTALLGHNVVVPLMPGLSEYRKMLIEKGIVVAAGIVCYFMATSGDSIYELAELAASFGSAGLVVCALIGLNSRFGGPVAALVTLVAGILFTLLTEYVFTLEAPYLSAMAGCIIVYVLCGLREKSAAQLPRAA
ncbi:MAG: sodium:solute symporter family protein [Alphaproteobacteria bacterium]|nr:sodium:solute symporter family protein [Alphaproteobacteria bacterium]